MIEKVLYLTIASSVCTFFLGLLIGIITANRLPYHSNITEKNITNHCGMQLNRLRQDLIKQENLRLNCEKTLLKLQTK